MDIINRITRQKTLAQIPEELKQRIDNMSDEERVVFKNQLESQLQEGQKSQFRERLSGGLDSMANIFGQMGGINIPLKKTEEATPKNDINDFVTREILKKEIAKAYKIPTETVKPIVSPEDKQKLQEEKMILQSELDKELATHKFNLQSNDPIRIAESEAKIEALNRRSEEIDTELEEGEIPEGYQIGYDKTGKKILEKIKEDKPSAAAEKRAAEEGKLADELGGLLKSFERAVNEARGNVPGFGAKGLSGRMAGIGAKVSGKAGYLPATNVYNAQRKAFATVVAKAAGEVRPTDEDIRRFVATLPDTGKSNEENALLISDIQEKVSKNELGSLWFNSGGKTPTKTINGQKSEREQAKQILLQKGYSEQEAEQMLGE